MSDAAGFAMLTDRQYDRLRQEVADAAAAGDRQRRREAAIDRLDGVDAVRYDGQKWLLLEIQPDGRVALETWDEAVTVEPTAVDPVD